MAKPRFITDVAIDCAIHQMKDPKNGWRALVPPENLGNMPSSGSGQIGLQALVALLHYNPEQAIKTLENYYEMCKTRFMLSEPWSWIYARAIISCWSSTVLIARRKGLSLLASKYMKLLGMWASTCKLMDVSGRVVMAGCRGWGHRIIAGGWDDTWKVANGFVPKGPGTAKYGIPGRPDDWGWLNRADWLCKDIYVQALSEFKNLNVYDLIEVMPQWGARTEFQLIGWKDGSRLTIMGDDEPGFDDEDENNNTPGLLAAGTISGKIVSYPIWPNPYDGKDHLRQADCKADIDGMVRGGWRIMHSHLGQKKTLGVFSTDIPSYKPNDLLFHIHCPADSDQWVIEFPHIPSPHQTSPSPEENLNAIQKLLRKLGLY